MLCFTSTRLRWCKSTFDDTRNELTPVSEKLHEKELEDSWSFNNSLDAEYSERWSTLPASKNRYGIENGRHCFDLRITLTDCNNSPPDRTTWRCFISGGSSSFYFFFRSFSLFCAHVNSNRLKGQCTPTISISFHPIETLRTSHCLELLANILRQYRYIASSRCRFVLCPMRLHKFSCMFPRVHVL